MEQRYSISVRVRRTTVEFTYVLVPMTDEAMQTDAAGTLVLDEKGAAHLDGQKVFARAVALAQEAPASSWNREAENIEVHPIQKAPEPGEASAPSPT